MNIILIYEQGCEFEERTEIEFFETEDKLISFITMEGIGDQILHCYSLNKEIKIEAYEVVKKYRVKK